MKKSRLIALLLVVALMLMGTAYAAWTQTINVTSTVETGILHVNLSNGGVNGSILGDKEGVDTTGLAKLSVQYTEKEDTKDVELTATEFFPGTTYFAHLKLNNDGTIPADVNLKDLEFGNLPMVSDDVEYSIRFRHSIDKNLYGPNVYDFATASGSDFASVMTAIKDEVALKGGLTLQVGEYAHMLITINFTEEADEVTLPEDGDFNFGFAFDVSQFNID